MDRGKAKSKSKTLGFTLYPDRKSEPKLDFLNKVQNLSLQPYQLGFQVCVANLRPLAGQGLTCA